MSATTSEDRPRFPKAERLRPFIMEFAWMRDIDYHTLIETGRHTEATARLVTGLAHYEETRRNRKRRRRAQHP